VQNLRKQKKCSFRQAEAELGDVADSLANDLGLGCMPGEEGGFDPRVLAKLGVSEPQLEELTRWPREW